MLRLPVSTSSGRRSDAGASSQPTRHPVIEKYLLTDPTTTASREVSQALAVGRPNVSPW